MIDEVKRVVETLRYCEETVARCGECPSGKNERGIPNCHRQGYIADLIESLAAELEQVKQERDGLNIMLGQAQSMLETRTRERDAAIEDINLIQSNEVYSCEICKYNHNGCYKRCDIGNRCFEWRGVQEADNAEND